MADKKIEDRVGELEIQLAFQDDHIQKLNDVLVVYQQRLEALEVGIRHYEKRLRELQEGVGAEASPESEVPPHY